MNSFVPYKPEPAQNKPVPIWKRICGFVPSVAFSIAILCLLTGDIPAHGLHDALARLGLSRLAYLAEAVDQFMAVISGSVNASQMPQALRRFVFTSSRAIVDTYLVAMAVTLGSIIGSALVAALRPKYSWRDIASW